MMRRQRRSVDVPTLVRMKGPLAVERAEAERFVRRAFRAAYGARIASFMPTLMGLRSDAGALLAVLGLRHCGSEQLFLEHYLERPVEQVLGAATGTMVERPALVEVGNFAVGAAGGGRWLITALTAYLYATGHAWTVFTCGPELQNAFHRLGVELTDLGIAEPERLPGGEVERWGRYYDQGPRVTAANVAQSHRVLSALYETECALSALWHGALQVNAPVGRLQRVDARADREGLPCC